MEGSLLELNNGVEMPALGFGVFQTPPEETAEAVATALQTGYRLIDTVAALTKPSRLGPQASTSRPAPEPRGTPTPSGRPSTLPRA